MAAGTSLGKFVMSRAPTVLLAASLAAACGPAERDGGTVEVTVTGEGPWRLSGAEDLAFTVDSDGESGGGERVTCRRADAGGGRQAYGIEVGDASVEEGFEMTLSIEDYVGPDTYYRTAASGVPALDATLSTASQTMDLTTESGGECDITVDPGETAGTFTCREIPEFSLATNAEELFVIQGTWSCLGLLSGG